MKSTKVFLALLVCFCLIVPQGFAKNVWEMAKSESYGEKAGGMLGRGLINVATSPVDLVVQTVNKTKEGPPFVGTLSGLGSGLGCTALRVSSGIVDVALSWVPGFNGFPVARSYDNCIEQEKAVVQPIQAPLAQMPIAPAVSEPPAPQQPVVTTTEEPAPTPKPVRRHNPYQYVKK